MANLNSKEDFVQDYCTRKERLRSFFSEIKGGRVFKHWCELVKKY
jgi:hypothetical protein